MLGYTNDSNPFLDTNLMQPFIWGKKMEKSKHENHSSDVNRESESEKRIKLMHEIEKVRKRRSDRELELEEIERLRTEEQRLREIAQYQGWQNKEEIFHLEQTKERSKIRLVESRQRPIDVIAKNILVVEAANDFNKDAHSKNSTLMHQDAELQDPIMVVSSLNAEQLDELLVDIESYIQLESSRGGSFVDFWRSLQIVASARISEMKSGKPSSVHKAISQDVEDLLRGKSRGDLESLEKDIADNIKDRSSLSADAEYWETMQSEVKRQLAEAHVQAVHAELLAKLLKILDEFRLKPDNAAKSRRLDSSKNSLKITSDSSQRKSDPDGKAGDSEQEMQATDEVALLGTHYDWQDKYRPRKPRYFNRVKTGWDWNKYNQTHYDFDNPPPKVVQGYKFTLFYPDLMDMTATPRYFVEPCRDSSSDGSEFVILRFHAGPPYEDVAFKIANREWDTNRRAGFVSVFERGVLQLHFNFQRAFYRR